MDVRRQQTGVAQHPEVVRDAKQVLGRGPLRATVVGERTGGGAHPRRGFRVHPCLEATISVARSEHPVTRTNWEGTGVVPDVETAAADALETALRLATDAKPVAPGR